MLKQVKWLAAGLVVLASATTGWAADQATPKAAALSFGKALLAGDEKGLKETTQGTDAEHQAAGALSKIFIGMKAMSDAATAKFGKDNSISKSFQEMDIAAELDKSEIKEEGDTATIVNKTKADDKPLKLVKKDGKWFVDLSSMPKEQMEQMVKIAPAMLKAANEVAGEIKADKYKTAEEANQAFALKMASVMMQQNPPAPPAEKKDGL